MPNADRIIPFEDLDRSDLFVGAVYLGGSRGNAGDDPLAKLLPVGNQGGYRHAGSPTKGTVRLSVLYTSGAEEEWPDELDAEAGVFTYFGDNRKPGRHLLETGRGGNRLLRDVFAIRNSEAGRRVIPPFFLFEKAGIGRGVRFLGLLAPGAPAGPEAGLTVVRHRSAGDEFENYRARFTVLDTQVVRREWLDDILAGSGAASTAVPQEWTEWVEYGPRKASYGRRGLGRADRARKAEVDTAESASTPVSAGIEEIPTEARVSETFEQERPGTVVAERREASLQDRYLRFLKHWGHDVHRQRILIPGEPSPLYTDLYDSTTGELIEVKSDSGRATVRLALGQILDYARYVPHGSKAVLMPSRPNGDLVELLLAHGAAVIWEKSPGEFDRMDP